jgi:DNA-binding SARP family transcriptional activator
VHLLNGLSVDTADGAVSLTGAVMAHVLSIVALRGSEHVEVVAELVWPDSEPGIAKRRFKHVLSRLRSACGDLLVRTGDLVALNPEAQVDVTAFERAAEDALGAVARREPDAAARCRHAVVLYRGELLPEDRYEEWTLDRRDALTQRLVRLFHALAELALVEGRPAEAVDWLERAMEADPYDESAVARAVAIMLEHDWTTRARGLARRAQRSADDLGIALPGELASLVEVPGPQPAAR